MEIYTNKIINVELSPSVSINICALDPNIVVRDPEENQVNKGQYADHINIDSSGGPQKFIKYFYK